LRSTLAVLAERQPRALILASLTGWLAVLAMHSMLLVPELCSSNDISAERLRAIGALNPPAMLMLDWCAMLLAMMPPLLGEPLAHLRRRSLARRRARAISAFVAGYGAVWLAAGIILLAAAMAIAAAATAMGVPVLLAVGGIAVAWQMTPARQICLNRCHWLPRLSAFGFAADRDCVSFGLAHGFWCAATCAPLMLPPLVAPQVHLPLMALLSACLMLERMAPAQPEVWSLRLLPGQSVAVMLVRSMLRRKAPVPGPV
jgi:predicted metal-binding membrane protein